MKRCFYFGLAAMLAAVFFLSTAWQLDVLYTLTNDVLVEPTELYASPRIEARLLPPYGDYCETIPQGEKELWNLHKKVISFSIFGPDMTSDVPGFVWTGFVLNVKLAKQYYPDWVIRVYTLNVNQTGVDNILALSDRVEVVKCHQDSPLNKLDNARRMITRFLVADDPKVRYAIIRDADSRFSLRELMAVNEWIASKRLFHAMRDHMHHTVPVMGGCFGVKRGLFSGATKNTSMTKLASTAVAAYPQTSVPGCCADDQNFLATYVWPEVKSTTLSHDMDLGRCRIFGSAVCRDFPLGPRTDAFFVGYPFKDDRADQYSACNLNCDWTARELDDWD
jgi:hypothetical protein